MTRLPTGQSAIPPSCLAWAPVCPPDCRRSTPFSCLAAWWQIVGTLPWSLEDETLSFEQYAQALAFWKGVGDKGFARRLGRLYDGLKLDGDGDAIERAALERVICNCCQSLSAVRANPAWGLNQAYVLQIKEGAAMPYVPICSAAHKAPLRCQDEVATAAATLLTAFATKKQKKGKKHRPGDLEVPQSLSLDQFLSGCDTLGQGTLAQLLSFQV